MNAASLPSASQYSDAIQNPKLCFSLPGLREGTLAVDRLGMPLVMAGNFAVVFKLRLLIGTRAVKCFCRFLGDREARFIAIDKQLDISKPSSLTGFDYYSRGILVEGKRYPILVMDWIEGPTLNVYIEEVLTKNNFREALASLADDWCRVVKELDDCQIAHGDLQHGNIIVTSDGIRLVDLDGTFVPGLTGQKAAELGHSHYQHPKRRENFFDAGLDRFSSLVIYLSLLAIAERPTLWKTFHDENLIFTKQDFTNPARSPLFQALDAMGGKVAKLARTLKQACLDDPSMSPRLTDLVAVKQPKLPSWMHSAPIVVVETKTREASSQESSRVPGTIGSPKGEAPSNRPQPTAVPQHSSSTTSSPSPYPLPRTNQGARAPYGASASLPGSQQQPPTVPRSSAPSPSQYSLPSPWQNLKGTGMDEIIKTLLITIVILPLSVLIISLLLSALHQSVKFFEVRRSAIDHGYSVTQVDITTSDRYRKAADRVRADSQHGLSAMYANGRGVVRADPGLLWRGRLIPRRNDRVYNSNRILLGKNG